MNASNIIHKGRIAYFCAEGGNRNPRIAALHLATGTLSKCASASMPPINVEELCQLRKVTAVEVYLTGLAGRLLPLGDHYIAEINARSPETRRRFTICHELGHTFFQEQPDPGNGASLCGKSSYEEMLEERLCDTVSAEFLMPRRLFCRVVADHRPGIDAVRRVAGTFRVSTFAAARRIIELDLWPAALLLFHNSESGMRLRSYSPARSLHCFRPSLSRLINSIGGQNRPCGRVEVRDRSTDVRLEYYTYGAPPYEYVCSLLVSASSDLSGQ